MHYHARVPRSARRAVAVAAALAAGAAVLRALAFSGTELYTDEAYYWLWSLRPAAGYFDHPPLVAWLIALTAPLLPGELGLRLPFLLAGGLTVLFAALLAGELWEGADHVAPGAGGPGWGKGVAVTCGALLCASQPMMCLVGGMALPDAPVAAAYTAALWLLARARGARWVWAGVAVGVALLAKYTAALLAPALLLLVVWDGELRRDLRRAWPWLGGLVAVAIFAPNLAWNARHGFVAIRFQLGHGFGQDATLRSALEYVGGQLVGAGPVPLFAGGLFLARARTAPAKRVAAAVLLPLAICTVAALRGRVEANWPALAYPALAAAAAALLARATARRRAALTGGSVALALALLATFGLEQRRPHLLAGTPALGRFQGWRTFGESARRVADRACAGLGCPADHPFVFTDSYQTAAAVAYYGGFRRLGPAAERPSELDLWDDRPAPGEPFLFIGTAPPRASFRARFAATGEGAPLRTPIVHAGERLRDLVVTPFSRFVGDAPER